jgi:hypothetical protein
MAVIHDDTGVRYDDHRVNRMVQVSADGGEVWWEDPTRHRPRMGSAGRSPWDVEDLTARSRSLARAMA